MSETSENGGITAAMAEFLLRLTDGERDQLLQLQLDVRAYQSARDRKVLDHQDLLIALQRKYSAPVGSEPVVV